MPILDAVFVGKIYLPEVWGGPIIPPPQPPSGAHPEHPIFYPPGIWGPPGPWPTPPIAMPPGQSPGTPPGFWGGGPHPMPPIYYPPGAEPPHPAHPIILPPGPQPPDPPNIPPTTPPDANWSWGWNAASGWHPVFVPGDKPQPPPV